MPWYYSQAVEGNQAETKYGRVVELVDSLDSGSSVHCGRAGSSPASPTKETVERLSLFLSVHPCQNGENPCVSNEKGSTGALLFFLRKTHPFATISIHFGRPRRPAAASRPDEPISATKKRMSNSTEKRNGHSFWLKEAASHCCIDLVIAK